MRLNPWRISFPPGDVRTDRPLGGFYQDWGAAVALVKGGYHGPMDGVGIPLVDLGPAGTHYSPILIAQYALSSQSFAMRGDPEARATIRNQAEWLAGNIETDGLRKGFWVHSYDNPKYPTLRAPWVSALAQGNGISALLRAGELLETRAFDSASRDAFEALHLPMEEGGTRTVEGEDVWLEEYPLDPPGHVLNGAIYALWGVLDAARAWDDEAAWSLWRRGSDTIIRNLEAFDTGFWSRYEISGPELTSVHYHKNIHIPQLQVLGALLDSPKARGIADRWRRYLWNPVSHARRRLEGRRRWRQTRGMRP